MAGTLITYPFSFFTTLFYPLKDHNSIFDTATSLLGRSNESHNVIRPLVIKLDNLLSDFCLESIVHHEPFECFDNKFVVLILHMPDSDDPICHEEMRKRKYKRTSCAITQQYLHLELKTGTGSLSKSVDNDVRALEKTLCKLEDTIMPLPRLPAPLVLFLHNRKPHSFRWTYRLENRHPIELSSSPGLKSYATAPRPVSWVSHGSTHKGSAQGSADKAPAQGRRPEGLVQGGTPGGPAQGSVHEDPAQDSSNFLVTSFALTNNFLGHDSLSTDILRCLQELHDNTQMISIQLTEVQIDVMHLYNDLNDTLSGLSTDILRCQQKLYDDTQLISIKLTEVQIEIMHLYNEIDDILSQFT